MTVVLRKGRPVVELAVVGPPGRESPWEGRKPFQLLIFSRMRLVRTSLLLHDWLNPVAGPVVARGGAVTGAPLNAIQGGPTSTRNDAGRHVEAVGGCIATPPVDRTQDSTSQAGRQRRGKQHQTLRQLRGEPVVTDTYLRRPLLFTQEPVGRSTRKAAAEAAQRSAALLAPQRSATSSAPVIVAPKNTRAAGAIGGRKAGRRRHRRRHFGYPAAGRATG